MDGVQHTFGRGHRHADDVLRLTLTPRDHRRAGVCHALGRGVVVGACRWCRGLLSSTLGHTARLRLAHRPLERPELQGKGGGGGCPRLADMHWGFRGAGT